MNNIDQSTDPTTSLRDTAASQAGGVLPIGAWAGLRVLSVAILLIACAVVVVCLLFVEPGHRLITGFVIGGMMTFIGLPFILAAAQDEVERMTGASSH